MLLTFVPFVLLVDKFFYSCEQGAVGAVLCAAGEQGRRASQGQERGKRCRTAGVASPAESDSSGEAGGGEHGPAALAAARGGVSGAEYIADLSQGGLDDGVNVSR